MIKNKLALLCMAGVLGLTTFTLAGCDPDVSNNSPGTGGGSTVTPPSEDTTKPDPKPEEPKEQEVTYSSNMNLYFSYNLGYTKIVDKSEEQAKLLADDLLYRLNALYGDRKNIFDGSHQVGSGNFKVDIAKSEIVTKPIHTCESLQGKKANALCSACYQETINNFKTNNGLLDLQNGLRINNAINGQYTSLDEGSISVATIVDNAWLYAKQGANKDKFVSQFANNLKPLVQRYLNKENVTKDIAKLVYSDVIGDTIYNNDNNLYESYFKYENPDERIIKGGSQTRLFKGYDIAVPAIIETALQNGNNVYKVFTENVTTDNIVQEELFNSFSIQFTNSFKVKSITLRISDNNVKVYNSNNSNLRVVNNECKINYNKKQFAKDDVLTFTFKNVSKPFTVKVTELVVVVVK